MLSCLKFCRCASSTPFSDAFSLRNGTRSNCVNSRNLPSPSIYASLPTENLDWTPVASFQHAGLCSMASAFWLPLPLVDSNSWDLLSRPLAACLQLLVVPLSRTHGPCGCYVLFKTHWHSLVTLCGSVWVGRDAGSCGSSGIQASPTSRTNLEGRRW